MTPRPDAPAPPSASDPTPGSAPVVPNARVALLLLAVSTLTVMAGAAISPALPGIARAFAGASGAALLVPLVLTLPALAIALGAPPAGALADRFGRVRLLAASAALYGVAGAAGAVAGDLGALLASRAVLGLAVAGVMTAATALIADLYQGPARAAMLGWQATAMGLGGMLFLTAGGALAEIGWRWPFFVYLAGLGLSPLVAALIDEPDRGARPTAGAPTTGAVRPEEARLPRGALALLYGAMLLGQVLFYTIPVRLPFYLEGAFGVDAQLVGIAVAVATLTYAFVAATFGRLEQRVGGGPLLAAGFAVAGGGLAFVGAAPSLLFVFAALAVAGAGFGLIVPNLVARVADLAPAAARGRALGGLTTALFLGQFLSPLAAAPLTAAGGDAVMYAILGGAGVAIGIALAAGGLLRARRRG